MHRAHLVANEAPLDGILLDQILDAGEFLAIAQARDDFGLRSVDHRLEGTVNRVKAGVGVRVGAREVGVDLAALFGRVPTTRREPAPHNGLGQVGWHTRDGAQLCFEAVSRLGIEARSAWV